MSSVERREPGQCTIMWSGAKVVRLMMISRLVRVPLPKAEIRKVFAQGGFLASGTWLGSWGTSSNAVPRVLGLGT